MRSGKPFTAGLMLPGRPAAYTSCGSSGGGIPGRRSADCAAASARSTVRSTFIITNLLYDERLCGSVQASLSGIPTVSVFDRRQPARRFGDGAAQECAQLPFDRFGDAIRRGPEARDVMAECALHPQIPVAALVGRRHEYVPRTDKVAVGV